MKEQEQWVDVTGECELIVWTGINSGKVISLNRTGQNLLLGGKVQTLPNFRWKFTQCRSSGHYNEIRIERRITLPEIKWTMERVQSTDWTKKTMLETVEAS